MKNVIPQTKEEKMEGLMDFVKESLEILQSDCTTTRSSQIINRMEEYINLIQFEHGQSNDGNTGD